MAFAVLFLLVYWTPLVPWYSAKLMGPWNDPDGDVLIVLSSEMQRDNIVGPVSYWRTVYAARVFRTGHFRTIVFSGGFGGGQQSLAKTMAEFASCYGVSADRILLEERSTSTYENALYTKQLLQNVPGKKILLTSDYHMFRALHTFRAVGMEVEPRPIPDMLKGANSRSHRWTMFIALGLETAKIVYYKWKGRI